MRDERVIPPPLAKRLLTKCLPPGRVRETVPGDLREMHDEMVNSGTPSRAAARWYWRQTFLVGGRYLYRRVVFSRLYRSHSKNVVRRTDGGRVVRLNGFWNDTRFAARSLLRNPGFATAAVLVLGIGIGAVSLVFSAFNAVVLQPLPFERPDRLVWVWATSDQLPRNTMSYSDYADYRDGADAFLSLSASMFRRTRVLTGSDGAERVITYPVSANFFTTLGVDPVLGRSFLPEEEETGRDQVAILSHGFWRRRFGADPAVIGSSITLDGSSSEVVGVLPADFEMPTGYTYGTAADVWFPLQRSAGYASGRGNNNFGVLGRLRDGVSIGQARAQVEVVAHGIANSYPDTKAGIGVTLVPLHEHFFGSARDILLLLAAIVSLVPLVACANVASLFVARAVGRRTELASRLALGASRARVVRQLLTEGVVVTLAGCVIGIAIAFAGGEALQAVAPNALPRLREIAIDGTVLSVTLAASFLMVPLFALVPAIRGTDMRIAEALKVGGGRGSSDRGSRLRNALVVAQVALCLMLLVASGLFFRSFLNLQSIDPGFRTDNVVRINALLPDFNYESREETEQVWLDVRRTIRAVPGVRAVGFIDVPPFAGQGPMYYLWAAERPPASAAERVTAMRRGGSRGYFDALGIDLVAGRHFEEAERWFGSGDRGVVLINEALARQFFPGEDPLGKTLVLDWADPVDLEVVGVTADVRELGPGSDPIATFYLPVRWDYDMLNVLIRTEAELLGIVAQVRQALLRVDGNITLSFVQTMQDRLSNTLFQQRFRSGVVGIFALVTVVLSAIGLYGVLMFFVRNRTHEIGIRLALGAGEGRAAGLVLKQGMTLVGSGLLIGTAGAVAGARLLQSWLFGIGVSDPVTYGGVAVFLVAVATVACLPATLRAVRLDPLEVLNAE